MLMYGRNQYNIVNQLSFIKLKINNKKRIDAPDRQNLSLHITHVLVHKCVWLHTHIQDHNLEGDGLSKLTQDLQ